MKDRISTFYPNITLYDSGYENKGIDYERMKQNVNALLII